MKYTIGLDLGISSIGWAILQHETNIKAHIIDCGVRIFDIAEVPKTGGSLAEERRMARGQRRTARRRRYRLQKTKELLIKSGFIQNLEAITDIFSTNLTGNKDYYNVYYLRSKALDMPLSNQELTQVLIHLVKHRGFKSNRKNDKAVDGIINRALLANKQLMLEKSYRSMGEMLYKDEKYGELVGYKKRNSFSNYNIMIYRADIEAEAKLILETQHKFGNSLITAQFIEKYLNRLSQQKSFDYLGNIRNMVGYCQFEDKECRAARSTLSALKFIAFSRMNNILYEIDGREEKLTPEQMQELWNLAIKTKSGLNFSHIRKIININDEKIRFNYVDYNKLSKDKVRLNYFDAEKNNKIRELELKDYHLLKDACIKYIGEIEWNNLVANTKLYDALATEITYNKDDENIVQAITKVFNQVPHNFDTNTQTNFLKAIIEEGVAFAGNINLSIKALNKIVLFLETGQQYDKACELAGYNHSQKIAKRHDKLPSLKELGINETITNPVVLRALSQMRKVVNALISKYGTPYQINVELAREIGKNSQERTKIERKQLERRDYNQTLINDFKEKLGKIPKGSDLERYKLWKQQDGKCLYSLEPISVDEAIYGNFCQVDHIMPWSISYDDSLDNKALVKIIHNQRKGNQTPYEYLGGNEFEWHKLTTWWQDLNKTYYKAGFTYKKLKNLNTKKYDAEGFKAKNLNDTRFIARETTHYLRNYLKFLDENNKKPVRVLNGGITAYLRYHWGLVPKNRKANDLHHAQDACVIAATTESMVNLITRYSLHKNDNNNAYMPEKYTYTDSETGEVFTRFPAPSGTFRDKVIEEVAKVFVSRMPRHKISGAVNDDTVRSLKYVDNPTPIYNNGKPFSTVRKPLENSKIKINADGEIDGICPTYKLHNPNLYEKIKERLLAHSGDPAKSFAKDQPPLYAPDRFGNDSNVIVKTIKIMQLQNTGVRVRQGTGIADNGKMVRVDIFNKDGKNYMVPIYEADVVKPELPNRAIVLNKPKAEWLLMDYNYKFLFSLYPNDFIVIKSQKKTISGYAQSFHGTQGQISRLDVADGSSIIKSIGIQSVVLEKYHVDVLDNKTLIKSEKRMGFNVKNKQQS